MRHRRTLGPVALGLILAGLLTAAAAAIDPEDRLADPALEARARAISRDLRCMQCQGQSIDDSNAQVARALRGLVRERLSAGDSDEAIYAAITARYGDYVLLKPRVSGVNVGLWFGPGVVLILGALAAFVFVKGRRQALLSPEPLSEPEREALAAALNRDDA